MTYGKKLLSGVLIAGLSFVAFLFFDSGSSQDEKEWLFVRESLFENEYGPDARTIARWEYPVTLGVIGASNEHKRLVREYIAELNGVFDGMEFSLSFNEDFEEEPNITVVFVAFEKMKDTADYIGIEYHGGNMGYFEYLTEGGEGTPISFAVILVALELSGNDLRRILIQEMAQVLGPAQDTPYFPESVIYEDGNRFSTATHLAPIDRKLLRFLYTHLNPGDDEVAVKRAFDAHWAETSAD